MCKKGVFVLFIMVSFVSVFNLQLVSEAKGGHNYKRGGINCSSNYRRGGMNARRPQMSSQRTKNLSGTNRSCRYSKQFTNDFSRMKQGRGQEFNRNIARNNFNKQNRFNNNFDRKNFNSPDKNINSSRPEFNRPNNNITQNGHKFNRPENGERPNFNRPDFNRPDGAARPNFNRPHNHHTEFGHMNAHNGEFRPNGVPCHNMHKPHHKGNFAYTCPGQTPPPVKEVIRPVVVQAPAAVPIVYSTPGYYDYYGYNNNSNALYWLETLYSMVSGR